MLRCLRPRAFSSRRAGAGIALLLLALAAALPAQAQNAPATGEPAISGSGRVGQTLTASTDAIMDSDGLTSPTWAYQWIRVDGTTETDVGTDAATYMPVAADMGKKVKVRVSFEDDDNNDRAGRERRVGDPRGDAPRDLPRLQRALGPRSRSGPGR